MKEKKDLVQKSDEKLERIPDGVPGAEKLNELGINAIDLLSEFLNIMYEVAPASIGGSIPGDDFYCILNG